MLKRLKEEILFLSQFVFVFISVIFVGFLGFSLCGSEIHLSWRLILSTFLHTATTNSRFFFQKAA